VVGLALAAVAPACAARRSLEITTEPPGATVILDDHVLGPTPLVVPFTHYGTHLLTLALEDHQLHSELVAVEPPWYGEFPWDLFSEVLVPIGWRDEHRVHRVLEPGMIEPGEPDLRSVLERAELLRRAGPDGPRRLPPPRPQEPPPLSGQEAAGGAPALP
jgi:hypothetical protein